MHNHIKLGRTTVMPCLLWKLMTFQVSTLGIFSHFEKSLGGPERTQVRVPIRKNKFYDYFTLFKNYSKCRTFLILAFSTNFCFFKSDPSGNTVWPQVLICFKNSSKLNATFSVIFKHRVIVFVNRNRCRHFELWKMWTFQTVIEPGIFQSRPKKGAQNWFAFTKQFSLMFLTRATMSATSNLKKPSLIL